MGLKSIGEMQRRFHKDLVIETFKEPPLVLLGLMRAPKSQFR